MVASATAAPQFHSHNGIASHPVDSHHAGFHQQDGLAPPPAETAHKGFHQHDGLVSHPVGTAHEGFHQHDGLAPHPVGTAHLNPGSLSLLSEQKHLFSEYLYNILSHNIND